MNKLEKELIEKYEEILHHYEVAPTVHSEVDVIGWSFRKAELFRELHDIKNQAARSIINREKPGLRINLNKEAHPYQVYAAIESMLNILSEEIEALKPPPRKEHLPWLKYDGDFNKF